ncbi:MAG: histidinol-phosphatase [Bacteroidota bacterium]|nr:histidinol-phosphatase [Bacteroidota bacterium]
MPLTNYHTHTNFCDGMSHPVHYVEEAIKQNVKILGFSGHAPLPFHCNWTINEKKYGEYLNTIQFLKEQFAPQIEICCGLEIDYIPELWNEIHDAIRPETLDYFIGSIHFIDSYENGARWSIDGSHAEFQKGWKTIFHRDSHAVIRKYFDYIRRMVTEMKPPVIGHLDKIKMQYSHNCFIPETDPIYRKELMDTLEVIAASDCIVEVNSRGVYKRNEPELYPSFWVLTEMARMNIPVTISSDAHRPREIVSLYKDTALKLKEAGFKHTRYYSKGVWKEEVM